MATGSPAPALSVVSTAPDVVREAVVAGLVRVRRNVEQADVTSLRAAYTTMQSRSESDNRSWMYWAEYHGYNRFDCWHHNGVGNQSYNYDLFLPWHRAYLLYFERVALAANTGATLPWWDWSSSLSHQVGIPAAFSAAQVGGQPNPLASAKVPAGLHSNPDHTRRQPGNPADLPSASDVSSVLALTNFQDFSNQVQNLHDGIHGWTGGDMGVIASSAFDPIFWSHHCMIDRLWYLWQLRHGVDNIPPSYLNRTLAPWALTVKDVLDISRLGYSYASSRVKVAATNFSAVSLSAANS